MKQEDLAARVGASALTLGGLLKHLAFVEDYKLTTMLLGEDLVAPWDAVDWKNDPDWPWHSASEVSRDILKGCGTTPSAAPARRWRAR